MRLGELRDPPDALVIAFGVLITFGVAATALRDAQR